MDAEAGIHATYLIVYEAFFLIYRDRGRRSIVAPATAVKTVCRANCDFLYGFRMSRTIGHTIAAPCVTAISQ